MTKKEEQRKQRLDDIFKFADNYGVKLTKRECLSLSKLNINTTKGIIEKFGAKKKHVSVSTVDVCIDKKVADILWSIWKFARADYPIIKEGDIYSVGLKGSAIFMIRSCAAKIYNALEKKPIAEIEQKGGDKSGGEN